MVFFRGMMELDMLKFFERRGGGGNSQDRQAERYVYDQNEARRLGAERQERKTVAALLYGNEYLGYPDVQLNNGDEERLLSEMRSGRVGENEERGMLLAIRDPIAQFGADRVTMGISGDKHRSRILAQMSGRGFENWQTVDSQDLMRFMQNCIVKCVRKWTINFQCSDIANKKSANADFLFLFRYSVYFFCVCIARLVKRINCATPRWHRRPQ